MLLPKAALDSGQRRGEQRPDGLACSAVTAEPLEKFAIGSHVRTLTSCSGTRWHTQGALAGWLSRAAAAIML